MYSTTPISFGTLLPFSFGMLQSPTGTCILNTRTSKFRSEVPVPSTVRFTSSPRKRENGSIQAFGFGNVASCIVARKRPQGEGMYVEIRVSH
jgi:hypothetical protein